MKTSVCFHPPPYFRPADLFNKPHSTRTVVMPHGKSKPRRGQESLGKALHRRRAQDRSVEGSASSYDIDGSKARGKMTSVLEANNLDDFIASAMMSERTFQSHRESTVVVGPDGVEMTLDEDGGMRVEEGRLDGDGADFDFEHMGVPRRPAWNSEMTAEELDALEREAFLEWRRGIASAEESNSNMKVTPFEKNLEVWRQLWRVIERSDLVCQLVDARNPLFYYSTDLETYASKLVPPKPTVVVVNKADYLSSHQQLEWARYFWNRGVTVLFFSARQQQEKLNKEAREGRNIAEGTLPTLSPPDSASLDRFESDDDVGPENDEDEESERDGLATTAGDVGVSGAHGVWRRGEKAVRLLNRLEMCIELERLARTLGVGNPERNGGRACVGMVGYPNVGKSSIINVLVGATPLSHGGVRVRVGATPGKTKHFQTLVLSDTLMLCDCPGLVFPSFVSSTAEMICAGVLPIMQMRNFMPPMTLVARRIPRHILELTYTIKLPILPGDTKGTHGKVILSPQQLLDAFCQARGLFRARALGEPDMPRAARQILKDYTDGRLVFCHPPPELTDEAEARFLKETNKTALKTTKLASKLAAQVGKASAEDAVVARSDAASLQHPENFDLMAEALEQRAGAACDIQLDLGIGVGSRSGGGKLTKREMGLKRWGKKDRKVSNKDPYGNEDLESAASFLPIGAKVSAGGKKSRRGKQKDGFTRVTLPHHQTYPGPT